MACRGSYIALLYPAFSITVVCPLIALIPIGLGLYHFEEDVYKLIFYIIHNDAFMLAFIIQSLGILLDSRIKPHSGFGCLYECGFDLDMCKSADMWLGMNGGS